VGRRDGQGTPRLQGAWGLGQFRRLQPRRRARADRLTGQHGPAVGCGDGPRNPPFKGHVGVVTSVAFSPDGTRALTGECLQDRRGGRDLSRKVDFPSCGINERTSMCSRFSWWHLRSPRKPETPARQGAGGYNLPFAARISSRSRSAFSIRKAASDSRYTFKARSTALIASST
jgi:WD40 repeat protein